MSLNHGMTMKQNKSQFIFDYYIAVPSFMLDHVSALLNAAGVAFAVEPWPSNYNRVYTRKDVAAVLGTVEKSMLEEIKKVKGGNPDDAADDGKGVPE